MATSILTSTKKALGIDEGMTAFDPEIMMYINTVFSTLNQLGIGPVEGYMIENEEATWDDFLADDPRYNSIQTYMYLRVRLLFDPPATSFAIAAMEHQIEEYGWRLSTLREDEEWVPPTPPAPVYPYEV